MYIRRDTTDNTFSEVDGDVLSDGTVSVPSLTKKGKGVGLGAAFER